MGFLAEWRATRERRRLAESYLQDPILVEVARPNATATNVHLVRCISQARRNGGKLVVVDPLRTKIAAQADLLRRADAIFIEELRNTIDPATGKSWYDLTSQAFTVFLPVKTVGVMGDGRTYDSVCALRAVTSTDGMTADIYPFDAAFLSRVATYLKAKTIMKDGLHYAEAMTLNLEAEYQGAVQGRNWKYPMMLADWRAMTDWQIADIREEIGITPVPPEGLWEDTNRLCNEDDPHYGQPLAEAAE